jgi:hypothetical protein
VQQCGQLNLTRSVSMGMPRLCSSLELYQTGLVYILGWPRNFDIRFAKYEILATSNPNLAKF